MNIGEYAAVFGMIITGGGVLGGAGSYWANNEFISRHEAAPYDEVYVLVASQNLKILFDSQDELSALQQKVANGTATPADLERIATLKERIRNLQVKQ
jgi:hypothetical protein